jgi:hypothetical protein
MTTDYDLKKGYRSKLLDAVFQEGINGNSVQGFFQNQPAGKITESTYLYGMNW